jgi:hypothetical protein
LLYQASSKGRRTALSSLLSLENEAGLLHLTDLLYRKNEEDLLYQTSSK